MAASQELLEPALCGRRRWEPDVFRAFFERLGSWDTEGEVAFGRLDPTVFSELVRDLEGLKE